MQPAQDALHLPGVAERDPAADRVHCRLADQRAGLGQLNLGELGRPVVQGVD